LQFRQVWQKAHCHKILLVNYRLVVSRSIEYEEIYNKPVNTKSTIRRAVYPGSFDPITFGHLDVIERATLLCDELIIAVADNSAKHPLFTGAERIDLIHGALGHRHSLRVERLDGLLVDFARAHDAHLLVRGLRAISDFEYEFQMALMNRRLHPHLETVFLTPKEDCTFISSRIVKEVARLGGDIRQFVPPVVAESLKQKFSGQAHKSQHKEET
jgi:pantetheine-phosphate adenylyltransferase